MVDIEHLIENLNSDHLLVCFSGCQQSKLEPEIPHGALAASRKGTKDQVPRITNHAATILINQTSRSQTSASFEITPAADDPNPTSIGPFSVLPPGDEPPDEYQHPEPKPDDVQGTRPVHPWFKIWIKPGETIREIINFDSHYLVIPIILIAGFGRALDRVMRRDMADSYDLPVVLLMIFFVGPIGGLVFNYLGGSLFSWLGKKLGGRASPEEVRTALAWPLIPWILVLVVDLFLLAVFGFEQFSSTTPKLDAMRESGLTGLVLTGLYGIWWAEIGVMIGFWVLALLVKCIAEAHQFSSWRSLATLAIPFFSILAISMVCLLPILI